MQWWRDVERRGKDYPVALTLISLFLGLVIGGGGGFYAGFNAGWLAGTSKPVADLGSRMTDKAVQAMADQKCGQEIKDARAQVCKVETILQWYSDKIGELGRQAQKLRDKPNASDQKLLDDEIQATFQQAEQFRTSLRQYADAFDGEASALLALVLKEGNASDINDRMIALANTFAAKEKLSEAALQEITMTKLP